MNQSSQVLSLLPHSQASLRGHSGSGGHVVGGSGFIMSVIEVNASRVVP